VDVLRNMVDAAKPGRIVLDLQVICPNPRVEVDSRLVCEIDGERWSRLATTTTSASTTRTAPTSSTISRQSSAGYPTKQYPVCARSHGPCVVRERCRLWRLRRNADPTA